MQESQDRAKHVFHNRRNELWIAHHFAQPCHIDAYEHVSHAVFKNHGQIEGAAMKRLFLFASVLCALAALIGGSVSAADRPVRPSYRPVVPVCSTCDWSGFYIGFNIGESKDWSSTTDTWTWFYNYPPGSNAPVAGAGFAPSYSNTFGTTYRHASAGFIGGLQWGYNW